MTKSIEPSIIPFTKSFLTGKMLSLFIKQECSKPHVLLSSGATRKYQCKNPNCNWILFCSKKKTTTNKITTMVSDISPNHWYITKYIPHSNTCNKTLFKQKHKIHPDKSQSKDAISMTVDEGILINQKQMNKIMTFNLEKGSNATINKIKVNNEMDTKYMDNTAIWKDIRYLKTMNNLQDATICLQSKRIEILEKAMEDMKSLLNKVMQQSEERLESNALRNNSDDNQKSEIQKQTNQSKHTVVDITFPNIQLNQSNKKLDKGLIIPEQIKPIDVDKDDISSHNSTTSSLTNVENDQCLKNILDNVTRVKQIRITSGVQNKRLFTFSNTNMNLDEFFHCVQSAPS